MAYLRQAASQGYAFAETDLGWYYARGLHAKKDLQEAVHGTGKRRTTAMPSGNTVWVTATSGVPASRPT